MAGMEVKIPHSDFRPCPVKYKGCSRVPRVRSPKKKNQTSQNQELNGAMAYPPKDTARSYTLRPSEGSRQVPVDSHLIP